MEATQNEALPWDKSIPEDGIPCYLWENGKEDEKFIGLVTRKENGHYFISNGDHFPNAEPIPPAEIVATLSKYYTLVNTI